jgi:tRNA(Ile)-lysidine synthase
VPFDLPLAVPGVTPLPGGRSIEATIEEQGPAAGHDIASFDLGAIAEPLRVRSRRPGDRIRPRGFGRTRKVQDLLTEARVPRAERDRVPLVVMGDEVIWVGGLRASEIGAAGPEGGRRLVLALREPAPDAGPGGPLS